MFLLRMAFIQRKNIQTLIGTIPRDNSQLDISYEKETIYGKHSALNISQEHCSLYKLIPMLK